MGTTVPEAAVAFVGCGPRATGHARAYAGMTGARIISCCDIRDGVAASFAARYGIGSAFGDLEDMMASAAPDLVHVITPPAGRLAVVQRILELGRPSALLIEKPLALLPQDAYHIIDACERRGVALFVNHQLRFFDPFRRLRELVMAGRLGPLSLIRASTRAGILEHGTHLFDMVSALNGDELQLTEVSAQAQGVEEAGPTAGAPAYVQGVFATADGPHLYFECGPSAPFWPGSGNPWHHFGVDLTGFRGSGGMSLCHGWWLTDASASLGGTHNHEQEDDPAQRRLVQSILGAIDHPRKHPCGPDRIRFSLDAIFSAHRSALRRTWVPVDGSVLNSEVVALRNTAAEGSPTTRVINAHQ
jgi:predicted dehydrogenase